MMWIFYAAKPVKICHSYTGAAPNDLAVKPCFRPLAMAAYLRQLNIEHL